MLEHLSATSCVSYGSWGCSVCERVTQFNSGLIRMDESKNLRLFPVEGIDVLAPGILQ